MARARHGRPRPAGPPPVHGRTFPPSGRGVRCGAFALRRRQRRRAHADAWPCWRHSAALGRQSPSRVMHSGGSGFTGWHAGRRILAAQCGAYADPLPPAPEWRSSGPCAAAAALPTEYGPTCAALRPGGRPAPLLRLRTCAWACHGMCNHLDHSAHPHIPRHATPRAQPAFRRSCSRKIDTISINLSCWRRDSCPTCARSLSILLAGPRLCWTLSGSTFRSCSTLTPSTLASLGRTSERGGRSRTSQVAIVV